MAISVEDLERHCDLSQGLLERECTDGHVRGIALFLESWVVLAPHLGLEKQQIEAIKRNCDSEEQKRIQVLEKWKEKFIFKATYKKLLEALLAIERADLARKVCELLASQKDGIPKLDDHESLLLSRLKETLTSLKRCIDTPNKAATVEENVLDFVTKSMSEQTSEQVNVQLQQLHKEDMLISKEVLSKAQEMVIKLQQSKESLPTQVNEGASMPVTSSVPLFSKDALYHASLCVRAVNTCDAGNYQKFFNNKMPKEPVPGHSFKAVSISRSNSKQDSEHFAKFLIAQKDETTYYFAFQGEQKLADWAKRYKSFNEGILAQSSHFPIRFILELLNKQCHIVLTGFSFGGLVACTIAAQVWDTPYISADLLKENMTCITFGQPHLGIQVIQDTAKRRPELVSTVHTVYLQDDPVPQLMSFLDKSWSAEVLRQSDGSKLGLSHVDYGMPFQDPTTSGILDNLVKLHDSSAANASNVLVELKSKLKEVHHLLEAANKERQPSTTSYLLACKESVGLDWSEMTVEQANEARLLNSQQVKELDITLFEKHSEALYSQRLFDGHLDKPPRFEPTGPEGVLGEVGSLKPGVEEVQAHNYGSETAIVLEGSNLWFCYQISFRGHSIKTPANTITGSSIRFNIQHELQKGKSCETEGKTKAKVVLNSHFSKPIKQDVHVYEKKFGITTRQEQLAKLTPAQVIELAYLSALLEQHPYSKSEPLSHKVEVFRQFLEDVVKVVPFESIVYAIANGSYETAVACYEALMSIKREEIPATAMMHNGLRLAEQRLKLGYPGRFLGGMILSDHDQRHGLQSYTFDVDEQKITCNLSPFRQLVEPPHTQVTLDLKKYKHLLGVTNEEMASNLKDLQLAVLFQQQTLDLNTVSERTIDLLYQVNEEDCTCTSKRMLKSPLNILVSGRTKLADLARKSQLSTVQQAAALPSTTQTECNQQMLDTLNTIRKNELDTCTSLLGGFMDQNRFDVALTKSRGSGEKIGLSAAASVGVWALFSLNYDHLQSILSQCRGDQLMVRILHHVRSFSGVVDDSDDNPYAAKLMFVVQGMTKTVTCNTQLISYSLERQLVELCKSRKIYATTPFGTLTSKWSKLFERSTLSLVAPTQRPLIARWLKWALMIHDLREELAKYTAVGVAGLVNSGKSKLVSTLFGIKIPTGTTERKRTTVPFLYNLDEEVEGLNVVDFPGVDDEDATIGELADLLLTIAQIILFVVDYKRVGTQSCKKWLERLQKENVPVLVCLTFGDRLYAEHMSDKGDHPSKELMTLAVEDKLSVNKKKLKVSDVPYFQQMKLFSFSQEKDSTLNNEEGRQKLRDVGIGTPQDAGQWLVNVFRKRFQGQEELANQLEPFFTKNLKDS